MDHFTRLPDQILKKVFFYLDYKDILNCATLNKSFNQNISSICKVDNLVISHRRPPLNQRLFETYQLVNYNNQIKTKDYSLVKFNYPILFSDLKQLVIISTDFGNFERFNLSYLFDQINQFKQLNHLELIGLKQEAINRVELKCDVLTTLRIERVDIGKIVLNTKSLVNLKIELFADFDDKLEFVHPNTVRKLFINRYSKYVANTFSNLHYLYIGEKLLLNELCEIDENSGGERDLFLTKLQSLRELQFYTEEESYDYLLEQKLKLDHQVTIYYCGINCGISQTDEEGCVTSDIECVSEIKRSPYVFLDNISIDFYVENHLQTASILPFAKRLIYSDLDDLIETIPESLMNKFKNLKMIEVPKRVNFMNPFVGFLKCFESLESLIFNYSRLDDRFFSVLPQLHPVLDRIEIIESDQLDLDFLLEFKDINIIKVNKNLDPELVMKLFDKFDQLRCYFLITDIEVSINVDGDRFEFYINDVKPKTFGTKEELFDFYSSKVELDDLGDAYDDLEFFDEDFNDLDEDLIDELDDDFIADLKDDSMLCE